MGKSFLDQNSASANPFSSMGDSWHVSDEEYRFLKSSFEKRPVHSRKKSSSLTNEKNSDVKDELIKFLADSKDEDLKFQKLNISKHETSNHEKRRNSDPVQRDEYFDRLREAGKKSSKPSRRKRKGRKSQQREEQRIDPALNDSKLFQTSLSKIFHDDEKFDEDDKSFYDDVTTKEESEKSLYTTDLASKKRSSKQKRNSGSSRQKRNSRSGGSRKLPTRSKSYEKGKQHSMPHDDATADESDQSLSLSDLNMTSTKKPSQPRRSSQQRRNSQQRQTSRSGQKLSTFLDKGQSSAPQLRTYIRQRSEIGGKTNAKSVDNDLLRGLSSLDKQVRRDRMKKEYRSRSVDRRGAESVVSGVSGMSNKSYGSRSYKRTGFEGGALNAIMGNESFARLACRGGDAISLSGTASIASAPAGEEFMKERKAKQQLIMDIAVREKWLRDAKAEEEAKRLEREKLKAEGVYFEEETGKKRKSLVKKMKKAVRKTVEISSSGAKGAVNAVTDPKLSAKKSYKSVNQVGTDQVGTETKEALKDSSSAPRRGSKGSMGSANKIISNVVKGGSKMTSSLAKKVGAKKGSKKTAQERRDSGDSGDIEVLHLSVTGRLLTDSPSNNASPKSLWWDI